MYLHDDRFTSALNQYVFDRCTFILNQNGVFFCVDIPHDSFVNDKSKVQTHTFTDFPPTAESDEEDVYDKTQVLGKCAYFN